MSSAFKHYLQKETPEWGIEPALKSLVSTVYMTMPHGLNPCISSAFIPFKGVYVENLGIEARANTYYRKNAIYGFSISATHADIL